MADSLKTIEAKIKKQVKLLEIAENESKRLFEKKRKYELEKHLKHVETRLEILQDLKYEGQEIMVAGDKEDEAVNVGEWCELLDERLARFDEFVGKLKEELSIASDREEAEARRKEDLIQEERFRRRMEEEVKIEEMKMEMKKKGFEFSRDEIVKSDEKVSVKLPKLKITKFEGTALDWLCFWNQFETEIDQVQITPIRKFSYLKELLVAKLRSLIEGLPFTSEGYASAKSILTSRYGKPSEIAATHIYCITSLPVISNCNPNRIQEFYEKLSISVQALKTTKNLKDIKGYVRLTLDKLPGIRADLVRLDDNWQE